MKKAYAELQIELMEFVAEDVLTVSYGDGDNVIPDNYPSNQT